MRNRDKNKDAYKYFIKLVCMRAIVGWIFKICFSLLSWIDEKQAYDQARETYREKLSEGDNGADLATSDGI